MKRAKNPSLVGLNGIVLQETRGTFKIVTPKSQIKGKFHLVLFTSISRVRTVYLRYYLFETVLAKQNSIFTIVLPLKDRKSQQKQELSLDIYGDSFAYRSAERVGRKWKAGTGAGGVELI